MRWLALAVVFAGCSDEPPEQVMQDPESAAVELLRDHVFDPVDQLRERFTPEVNPADFALRLMLDGPDQYRFIDIWRLRMVDGRLVVWALVELEGAPHVFEMWLELQGNAWRVAGWSQVPEPVALDRPAPPAGTRVPTPFAAATFRGAPPARVVGVEVDRETPATASQFLVRLKTPSFDGACPKASLVRKLQGLQGALGRCYAAAVDAERPRAGRLTFTVLLDGRVGKSSVRVTETTLVDEGLTKCAEAAVATLPVTVGSTAVCSVSAPFTFRPRDRAPAPRSPARARSRSGTPPSAR